MNIKEINYKAIDTYSRVNQERIVDFLKIMVPLLEIKNEEVSSGYDNVSASILNQKYGFDVSELNFFIRAIDDLLSEQPDPSDENNTIYIGNPAFSELLNMEIGKFNSTEHEGIKKVLSDDAEKYTSVKFRPDSIFKLKLLLSELVKKGYGKKEIEEHNKIHNQQIDEFKSKKKMGALKFKHKLPAGTMWSFFTFIFIDSENVKVNVGKFTETLNYKDLGLDNKKNNKPKISWVFFYILAQHNGELKPNSEDKNDSYKKAKQSLSATLKDFFSISYDPFYPYHTSHEKIGNSYKAQFFVSCENLSTTKEMEDEEKSYFEQYTDSI